MIWTQTLPSIDLIIDISFQTAYKDDTVHKNAQKKLKTVNTTKGFDDILLYF